MATPMNPADRPLAGVPAVLTASRWEWFRLSQRVAFWVIIGLMGAGVAATLAALLLVSRFGGFPFSPYDYQSTVAVMLGTVGPFLAVILASIVYGGDFGWDTWRPLTARGMARWQIGLAKLLVAAGALAVFWAAAWGLAAIVGLAAGSPSASTSGGGNGPAGWGEPAVQLGAAWLVALAYLGLGAVLTTAGRSTAFGLGVGVGVILFELAVYPLAGLAGKAFDIPVGDYTLWTLWGVTGGLVNGSDESSPSRWVFLGATLGYGGLFWGLTLLGLSRRDLGSGNG